MMSIFNRTLSVIVDTIRIRIRIEQKYKNKCNIRDIRYKVCGQRSESMLRSTVDDNDDAYFHAPF